MNINKYHFPPFVFLYTVPWRQNKKRIESGLKADGKRMGSGWEGQSGRKGEYPGKMAVAMVTSMGRQTAAYSAGARPEYAIKIIEFNRI